MSDIIFQNDIYLAILFCFCLVDNSNVWLFCLQPFWKVANNSYGKGRGVVGKKCSTELSKARSRIKKMMCILFCWSFQAFWRPTSSNLPMISRISRSPTFIKGSSFAWKTWPMNTGKAFSWFVPLNICNVDVNFVIFPISYEPTCPHRWLRIHCTHNSITQGCACTFETCKQPHVHAHTVHTVHLWLRRLKCFSD